MRRIPTMIDTTIDLYADIIDVRDIVARIEEIEDAEEDTDEFVECVALLHIMDDLVGMGGDEQWRGNWYPLTLIDDLYFEDYARELAEDIGATDSRAAYSWPHSHIDWKAAAEALQQDYSSVVIDGREYWTR